jgi:tetratricopeptide (TPR) repeat protein
MMWRPFRTANILFRILVLTSACLCQVIRPVVFGQAAPAGMAVALKERDRLANETERLRLEGKTSEAIAAARAMLAIERRYLGSDHLDVAGSFMILAELHMQREEFAAAAEARRESLAILRAKLGERDWQVVEARWYVYYAERLTQMGPDERREWAEEMRLQRQVVSLMGTGKSREALTTVEKALAIERKLFGERHPSYALSLRIQATLLKSQGDTAAARGLLERVLAIQKEFLGEHNPAYGES